MPPGGGLPPGGERRAGIVAGVDGLHHLRRGDEASGTGTAARIEGVPVAGKTGTAQTGIEGENPHTWFIAFAPAHNPKLAIAVIVEHGGAFGSEATGGAVAAPIARTVLDADRRIRPW
jgi:peptidoglycan glycosyltransferase